MVLQVDVELVNEETDLRKTILSKHVWDNHEGIKAEKMEKEIVDDFSNESKKKEEKEIK